jgi:transposase-like protein
VAVKATDRTKLLFGPYRAPALKRGDRAACLFKDCDVVVTGWTDARISWPRCRPVDVPRTHPSLLVDEELARAIRRESAAALRFWWGVSTGVVHRWRKALGVDRLNCPGSQRLIRDASEQGAAQTRGKELPTEQVERRRRTAIEKNLAQHIRPGYNLGPWWSRREVALLGKLPDEEVATKVGRTPNAVRIKREKLGIPNPRVRRRRG